MRVPTTILAVVGLSVGLLSCGGDDRTTTTTSATTAATTAVTGTASTVPAVPPASALLTVDDLGTGWQRSNEINEMDLASFAQIPCEGVTLDPTVVTRLTASTGVQFEPIDQSYRHVMELVTVGVPDQLATDLRTLRDTIVTCPAAEATATSVRVEPFDLPALGDQRFGQLLRGYEGDALWYVRGAHVRIGGVAVMIGLAEVLPTGATAPTVSDATFVQLVTTAVAKLST